MWYRPPKHRWAKDFFLLPKTVWIRELNLKQYNIYSVVTTFPRFSNTVTQLLNHTTFTSHQMRNRTTRSYHCATKSSERTENQLWDSRMTKSENLQKSWMSYSSPCMKISTDSARTIWKFGNLWAMSKTHTQNIWHTHLLAQINLENI